MFLTRGFSVPEGAPSPLDSDSRRRPDRSALLAGDSGAAGEMKHALEERQRAEKRVWSSVILCLLVWPCAWSGHHQHSVLLQERIKRNDTWTPRWFQKPPSDRITHFPWECSVEEIDHWEPNGSFFASQADRPRYTIFCLSMVTHISLQALRNFESDNANVDTWFI